ncbi:Rha family transcriptional regulator [Rhizobium sp. FKY42]|uniref:Rha family transcriptional regulator n=1 Tax=Rhizobium sp. FKY42 TaxID=2562310 RepID=UPI0010BFFFFE|nr:Rha family transcriptional regulator [Rhizobium sp. FKY42]
MNQIVNLNTASTLTMSSREIALVTDKRHADVMRDIRAMFVQLEIAERTFASSYQDMTGRTLPTFNLPKRETLILVSGYSVALRTRIIDRWIELEAKEAQQPVTILSIPNFANPAEAARATTST